MFIIHRRYSLERMAYRQVRLKLGWFMHASIYLAVNLIFAALNALDLPGHHAHAVPFVGWGIGLAVHGLLVLFITQTAPLRLRMYQRERDRLQSQRDPW